MSDHRARTAATSRAVAHVVDAEIAAGRHAIPLPGGTTVGVVSNPPRLIEVFAFDGAATGLQLDGGQIDAALTADEFWVYVVENVAAGEDAMTVTRLGGEELRSLVATRVEHRWAEVVWPGAHTFATEAADPTEGTSPVEGGTDDTPADREQAFAMAGASEEPAPQPRRSRWFF